MADPNLELVERMYEAANAVGGDLAAVPADQLDVALSEFFDPDVEVEQMSGFAGTSGLYRGYVGLRQASREIAEALEGVTYEVTRHASRDDVVVTELTARATGRGSGVQTVLTVAHQCRFRNGRISRWVIHSTYAEALRAAGIGDE